jgi:hypothetical protein
MNDTSYQAGYNQRNFGLLIDRLNEMLDKAETEK